MTISMLKPLALLLFLIASQISDAQPFWVTRYFPESGWVTCISTSPSGDIYANFSLDALWKSRDEGRSWEKLALWPPFPGSKTSVVALNDSDIFYSGEGGVYRSSDGGNTWQTHKYGIPVNTCEWLAANKAGELFAVASLSSDGVFRSTDLGESWQKVLALKGRIYQVHISPISQTIFVRNMDSVCRSTDNGQSWSLVNTGNGVRDFRWFATDSSGNLIASVTDTAGHPNVAKSTDDGVSWFLLGMPYIDGKVILVNKLGHIFVGSFNWGVYRSTDGGATSEQLWRGLEDYAIYSLGLMPDGRVLAGGRSRLFISVKSTTDLDPPPRPVPRALVIESVYPQPARDRVAIEYAVPSGGAAELRVFDALGRLVRSDRQEHLAPGRYAFLEEIGGLVPGAYCYVVMAAGQYVRGTLILSR
jgi:photosystem II stability/assembly factor-like uncharacterized protein